MSKAKPKRGDRLKVEIEKLSVGGRGVARADGFVLFVSDTAPKEVVYAEITFAKKSFAEARVTEILTPSLHRVKPLCPVAGICGGCNWQHVEYSEQLRQKRLLVFESLKKFSGFELSSIESVSLVVASPKEFRYRNRVQFHFSGKSFGYFKRNSHDLVNIDDCPITESAIAQKIPDFRRKFETEKPGRAEAKINQEGTVEIHRTDSGESDEEGGLSFSQVNSSQNVQLVERVLTELENKFDRGTDAKILDLYCGSGNFTFALADRFKRTAITGVELNLRSIEYAKRETDRLGLSARLEYFAASAEDFLAAKSVMNYDIILLDPPRTGASPEVIEKIVNSGAKTVVYVSCHPVTLARDLKAFSVSGFTLQLIQPFDMFPQTDHVETLVVLSKSPAK